MGQLRQRGNIWWIRYYRNGKRYQESSNSDKWKVASDLLKTREGDIANGVPVTPQRLTFDDAMQHVLDYYRLKNNKSIDAAERRIDKHLKPFFGEKRKMTTITSDVVRQYATERLDKGAARASVNRELALLKLAFNLSLKAKRLLFAPYIQMLEEDNTRQGFLEPADFTLVRARLPRAVQAVVSFAYITGWRVPSEVLTLTWAQVDFKAGIVRLEPGTTKNKEAREFPFGEHPELKALMDDQRAYTDEVQKAKGKIIPEVFHRAGEPIVTFYKSWRAACRKAGFPGRIPHDMRRSAVRNIVRAGVPEKTAMQLTGHKTRSVFERYNISNESDRRSAVRMLAGTKQGQSDKSFAS